MLTVPLLGMFATPFHSDCNGAKIIANLAMLPLGYFDQVGLTTCLLLPQTWSLGLELSFYLVAPALLLSSRRTLQVTAVVSAGVFLLAFCGLINTNQWGYRLLPGTLFIFLTGASIADRDLLGKYAPWLVLSFCASLFAISIAFPTLYAALYNKEVLLGLILGIPTVFALRNRAFSATDEFLGNLSYGVFLNHFVLVWLAQSFFNRGKLSMLLLVLVIGCSMILAFGTYRLVELRALQWRRSIRYQPSRAVSAAE